MGTETFQKRQKENARKEKHKLKLARRLERKNEKVPGENSLDVDILELERAAEQSAGQSKEQPGPTN
jgi:hypothetical protein